MENKIKFNEVIHKMSNWKNIFFLAVILLVIIGIILPEATLYIKECINGNKRLDMAFFYTPEDVYNCMEAYGAKGRQAYVFVLLTLDFIFPVFYTLFLCFIFSVLLKQLHLEKYIWPIYLPLIPFVFDIVENVGITFLLFQYPMKYSIFVRLTAMFNVIKWIAFGVIILMVISAGTVLLFHFYKDIESKIQTNKNTRRKKPEIN